MIKIEESEIYFGQIWYVDLGENNYNFDSVQKGLRPCVVVSNNFNNSKGGTANIVPLTTKEDSKFFPMHCLITSALRPSIALCEQIQTVSKNSFKNFVGMCSWQEIRELKICLMVQLAII